MSVRNLEFDPAAFWNSTRTFETSTRNAPMQAFKCHAIVPEDHRLMLPLPAEIPTGEVEIIVLFRPEKTAEEPDWAAKRLAALEHARERFGNLLTSSEDFAAAKQEEIVLEESRFER
jgi:hypothetical protein